MKTQNPLVTNKSIDNMPDNKLLKSGYTTGVHAVSAFKVALETSVIDNKIWKTSQVKLPSQKMVELPIQEVVQTPFYSTVTVIKSDNDDIDVTKGCEIKCFISHNIEYTAKKLSDIDHKPYVFIYKEKTIQIYAGKGLGIVTKQGLKAPVGYPAINETTRKMLENEYIDFINKNITEYKLLEQLYVVFEVSKGEEIAEQTANKKVGVIGGISFLGTHGIVKPVSNRAYIDSIETEMNVAEASKQQELVLTMGNSALQYAKNQLFCQEESIIEIANYLYDSLYLVSSRSFKSLTLVSNIAKLTKVAQRKKNTHNTYGGIDFLELKQWLIDVRMPAEIISETDNVLTVAHLEEYIKEHMPDTLEKLYATISRRALFALEDWLKELNASDLAIKVIMTDGEILKYQTDKT
jgi:cobalt-precorrin-5B (C1)-methyltransferase